MTAAPESGFLRPRARLLHTIGTELISNERVAVMELVKNAYDADADRVVVRLTGPLELGLGRIEVLDDGHGMSAETLRSTWLDIATPHRSRARVSEGRRRRVLGEKGIGRFAASRLADRMLLVSRRAGQNVEVSLELDWNDFKDPDKYLDQLPVSWSQGPPKLFDVAGNAATIWSHAGEPPAEHGTLVSLSGLTSSWSYEDVYGLRRDLSRLVSLRIPGTHQDFAIFLLVDRAPETWGDLTGPVAAPAELERAPYRLLATVDEAGHAEVLVEVAGEQRPTARLDLRTAMSPRTAPDTGLLSGPFSMEIRVWDRDREAMATQTGSDLSPRQFARILDDASGVSVYRDGFRVLPFGEPGDDWLGLDRRRINNPSLRISNNQIIGEIFVSQESNPGLRDQTNREGLIEGPEYDTLKSAVITVISVLERERFDYRRSRNPPAPRKRQSHLFEDLAITDVAEAVRGRHGDDPDLIALVNEREKRVDEGIARVKEVLARYSRLATLGRLVDDVVHQGQHAIGLIRNKVLRVEHLIQEDVADERRSELAAAFQTIDVQSDVLATVFRRIAPFGGRRRGRPREIVLEDTIRETLEVLEYRAKRIGAQITVRGPGTSVKIDPVEVQDIVVNLVDNALYWVSEADAEDRHIRVSVARPEDGRVTVTVSDTGPGVPEDIRDIVFEPYFSTKPDGTGLGLAIAGEILADYYDGELELLESELGGATFRATFRRRV